MNTNAHVYIDVGSSFLS